MTPDEKARYYGRMEKKLSPVSKGYGAACGGPELS